MHRSDSDSSLTADDSFPQCVPEASDRARSLSSMSTFSGKLEALHGTVERIGNYILGKTMGEGAFAKVKEAVHSLTGARVAMKIVNKSKIKDPYVQENFRREGELLRRLNHRHVVSLYEIIDNDKFYCLVMEIAEGGEVS